MSLERVEILSLRILTMIDAEKREVAATDEHTRILPERTEQPTAEHFFSPEEVERLDRPEPSS
jgi:hypothetical protein